MSFNLYRNKIVGINTSPSNVQLFQVRRHSWFFQPTIKGPEFFQLKDLENSKAFSFMTLPLPEMLIHFGNFKLDTYGFIVISVVTPLQFLLICIYLLKPVNLKCYSFAWNPCWHSNWFYVIGVALFIDPFSNFLNTLSTL